MSLSESIVSNAGIGKLDRVEGDLIFTDKAVWCTTLNTKRIREVSALYPDSCVSYCPNPLITASSRRPREGKMCTIFCKGSVSNLTTHASKIMTKQGYTVKASDITELSVKELTRLAKTSSFAILDGINCSDMCYYLISAGTVFICINCEVNNSEAEIIRLSNYSELVSFALVPDELTAELMTICGNVQHIERLLLETSSRLKNTFRWIKRGGLSLRNGRGNVLVDLAKPELILRPWVGLINTLDVESAKSVLENNRVKVSMIMCQKLLITNPDIASTISGVEVELIRPFIQRSDTLFGPWTGGCTFVGEKMIYLDVPSGKKTVVTEIVPNTVVVLADSNNSDAILKLIASHTPIMLTESKTSVLLLGNDYTFFMKSLTPDLIVSWLRDRKGHCAVEHVQWACKHMCKLTHASYDDYASSLRVY